MPVLEHKFEACYRCLWCGELKFTHRDFRYSVEEKRMARMFLVVGFILGIAFGANALWLLLHLV